MKHEIERLIKFISFFLLYDSVNELELLFLLFSSYFFLVHVSYEVEVEIEKNVEPK